MQADHGVDVGAGARELQHVAAAEAEADRGLLRRVADAALVGFGDHGVERRLDALAAFDAVGAHRHHQLAGFRRAGAGLAVAVHVGDEGDVLVARHFRRRA